MAALALTAVQERLRRALVLCSSLIMAAAVLRDKAMQRLAAVAAQAVEPLAATLQDQHLELTVQGLLVLKLVALG